MPGLVCNKVQHANRACDSQSSNEMTAREDTDILQASGEELTFDKRSQRSAYILTKVGCATAFSKTRAMDLCKISVLVMVLLSCSSSTSNFSGVSLLSIPLTALTA